MSKGMRLVSTIGVAIVCLCVLMVVLAGSSAPPSYVEVRSPLLFSEIPVEEPVVAENDETCWSAPYLTNGSPRPDFCVHWPADGPTTTEAQWTKEQLSLAQGSGNGVALWSDGTFAITYRDGTMANCNSAEIANANIYRVWVPSGTALWQGEIWDDPPGCTHTASPTSTISILEISGEEFPVTVTLKIAGGVAWEGTVTETGVITVPVSIPSRPWSLVETETRWAQGYTEQVQGWMWSMLAPTKPLYLPIILRLY